MAKVKTPFKCLCGHEQGVTYKKPNLFQPTLVSVTCHNCDSRYMVKFKKDLKLAAGMIGIETRVEHMSDTLTRILEARQAESIEMTKKLEKAKDEFRFGDQSGKTG